MRYLGGACKIYLICYNSYQIMPGKNNTPQSFKYNYYLVPNSKLVVMSITTLGLYEIYWFYKNWVAVRKAEQSKLKPLIRALLAPISFYYLLNRMQVPHKDWLALIYMFFAYIAWRLPDPWWWVSILTFLPLIYTQNQLTGPTGNIQTNTSYSKKEITFAIIGGVLCFLALIGTIFPE